MAKVKIRITRPTVISGKDYFPAEKGKKPTILDLEAEVAGQVIAAGKAELVTAK